MGDPSFLFFSPLFPSPPFHPLLCPTFPFSPPSRSRPPGPKYSQGVWESAVSSPSGVWGKAPDDKQFGAYFESKRAALVVAIFCGVTRKNIFFHYFLHKNN